MQAVAILATFRTPSASSAHWRSGPCRCTARSSRTSQRFGVAIERIGKEHFGWVDARRELREALDAVPQFAERDAIATACNGVVAVSDEAYFYAGQAFGVTLAELT
jgi:hypothetical protein